MHNRHALSSAIANSNQEPFSGQACSPPDPYRPFSFWRSPSHGAQPLGLVSSHQSSHQGAQASPAHPPPPKLARHLRLTNQTALRCQGMGRGGGGAAGRTMKTRIIHTSVRRPAQRTPRPPNLHSDPDLQIRQPCGVRERGGAVEVLLGAP